LILAKILREMQASASRAALTMVETIGLIAAQDAINAALKVLSAAVNRDRRHRDPVTPPGFAALPGKIEKDLLEKNQRLTQVQLVV
jgi:hypothetical protein